MTAPSPTPPSMPPSDHEPDAELHALYREGSAEDVPAPELDRLILAAAHAATAGAAAPRGADKLPWWRAWRPLASVLAAGVIGLAVTLNVLQQQQMADRVDMAEASSNTSSSAAERSAPVPKPATETAQAPMAASGVPPRPAPAAAVAPAADVAASAKRAAPVVLPQAAPAPMEPAPAVQGRVAAREKAEVSLSGAASVERSARDQSVSQESVDQTLTRIREMVRAGKLKEARELIQKLKHSDPAVILPKDIEALLVEPGRD